MNLEDFIKNRKPKRTSKLNMYDKEIKTLIKNGFTVPQIHEYLTLQKIEISLKYLYRYTLKLKKNTSISSLEIEEIPNNPKSEPKKEEKKEDQKEEKKEDEKPKVDPFEALRKSLEEDKKNGTTKRREVPYWEPKNSRVRDWDKGTLMDPDT